MYLPDIHKIWLATGEERVYLEPSMANRHGLIAGDGIEQVGLAKA